MMDYTWVLDQVKDANLTNDLYTKTLIEFCTEEDSQLGQVAIERNDAKNIRITRKEADLSKKAGLDYALRVVENNPGAVNNNFFIFRSFHLLQHGGNRLTAEKLIDTSFMDRQSVKN